MGAKGKEQEEKNRYKETVDLVSIDERRECTGKTNKKKNEE